MNVPPPKRTGGMLRLCAWSLRYTLARRLELGLLLIVLLLDSMTGALKPWPIKVLVDNVFGQKPMNAPLATLVSLLPGAPSREALLAWTVAATVLIFLVTWMLGFARSQAGVNFGQHLVYDVAGDLFDHLQRLSLRFHGRQEVGDLIRRLTTDCACVSTIVRDAFVPAIGAVIGLTVMFGVIWRMDRRLALFALLVGPPMLLLFRRYAAPMEERAYEQQEAEGRFYSLIEQTLTALPIVQAFGREEHGDERFRLQSGVAIGAALEAARVQVRFRLLIAFTAAMGTALVLWLGAHEVLDGRLTVGGLLVFLAYLASVYGPLESLAYAPLTIHTAAASARRVWEVLETKAAVSERPGALWLPRGRGEVRVEGVTGGYEPGGPVLHEGTVTLRPNQGGAVVGATGAGKSTLASLLPRLLDPWAGRVMVDGYDIRDVQLKSLRAQVAVVLQEPFLFPGTIFDNIAYGRPDAGRAAVEAAARAAQAHDFIVALPLGYDTVVGERGGTLAGGERQRLAIARALVKDAPILVLDEPTAALDAEHEQRLVAALGRLMVGRTTLVIAHRLSTVRRADEIVVLDAGRVVERGPHVELVARGGRYAALHAAQAIEPSPSVAVGQS